MKPIDITGHQYGLLTAISRETSSGRRTMWLFHCECGTEKIIALESVRAGLVRSCGCLRKAITAARSTTHGHSLGRIKSRTLRAWTHAKNRCYDPRCERFPHYGGRGIKMCDEWRDNFSAFLRDMGECPPNKSLDRLDPNKNYEPGNCRWATNAEQARTRTDNIYVFHEGQRMILKDFASILGINYKRLHRRVRTLGEEPHIAAAKLV